MHITGDIMCYCGSWWSMALSDTLCVLEHLGSFVQWSSSGMETKILNAVASNNLKNTGLSLSECLQAPCDRSFVSFVDVRPLSIFQV